MYACLCLLIVVSGVCMFVCLSTDSTVVSGVCMYVCVS